MHCCTFIFQNPTPSINDYWSGEALIMSFINVNVENTKSEAFARVLAWEGAFLAKMKSVSEEGNGSHGLHNCTLFLSNNHPHTLYRPIEVLISLTK